jgi:ubiquitin C-terminal hydrolase
MQHNRDLQIGIIFKEGCGATLKHLDPEFSDTYSKHLNKKEKESISLDACFKAFSREELLTGSDQWYCNKCKEQRDIHKKLELYKLPRILIIQLKRF